MSRLQVALDGRPLQSQPIGGVGRYMAGLIPLLAESVDLYVLLDARRETLTDRVPPAVELVALSAPRGLPGLAWLELAVAPWVRRQRAVFHATFNTLPMTLTGPGVLTLHDLAPQLHPEDFKPLTRAAWRFYIRQSVKRAAAVTTVSEFVKSEIVKYFGVASERIHVAPDALDPLFDPARIADATSLVARLGIRPPYIIALGGANRRALPVAIEAWRLARAQVGSEVELVVTGGREPDPEPGLVPVGYLEDEDWATLLAGAQALCYPTRYEGFGLPALEAAASGTPVVCAPVASLPEVLGDAACWAQTPTAPAIADVLARVLADQEWHRQRREAGLERARYAPTWGDTADVLLQAYQRAAETW